MKILFLLFCIAPDIAFAQYYAGADFSAGHTQVKIEDPRFEILSQTNLGALLRLYNGYEFSNHISVEVGGTVRTHFNQSANFYELPQSGYQINLNRYNLDIILGYRLPEYINSNIKILTGLVWTKDHYQIGTSVLGHKESYPYNDIYNQGLLGIQYISPISDHLFWKTTLMKYGRDKILTMGIFRTFN